MHFPASLEEAEEQETEPTSFTINERKNNIHFTACTFKYLGAYINTQLNKTDEIKYRIKWAWSQIGMMKQLFNAKDISQTIKYWVYTLNTMLWGAESWNISQANINKLNAFHHLAIRQILGIRMKRVQEEKIMNEEVRRRFGNTPPIEVFITRRTWRYIGKIVRDNQTSIPKKLLGAWIHQPRKAGRPQNSNRNHFITTLHTVIPELSKKGLFCE